MSSRLTDQGWVVEPDVVDERKDLPRLTGAQIAIINARIALGSGEFPIGTQVIRSDDGVTLTLQGVGTSAAFTAATTDVSGLVSMSALASVAGAAAVGIQLPGANAQATSLYDIVARNFSIFGWLTKTQIAAIVAGTFTAAASCSTAVHNAMIDVAALGGGVLTCPAGGYLFDVINNGTGNESTYAVPRSGVSLIGSGNATEFRIGDGQNALRMWNVFLTAGKLENCIFRDFKINGNAANNLLAAGPARSNRALSATGGGKNVTVDNVSFLGFPGNSPVAFSGTTDCGNIRVQFCRFWEMGSGIPGNVCIDHTDVYLCGEGNKVLYNDFRSTNFITGAAWEFHGDRGQAIGNEVKGYSISCWIAPVEQSVFTQTDISHNNFVDVYAGPSYSTVSGAQFGVVNVTDNIMRLKAGAVAFGALVFGSYGPDKSGAYAEQINFLRNTCYGLTGENMIGAQPIQARKVNVSFNHLENFQDGIRLNATGGSLGSTYDYHDVTIEGNTIKNCSRYPIHYLNSKCKSLRITSNTVLTDAVLTIGIFLNGTAEAGYVGGNLISPNYTPFPIAATNSGLANVSFDQAVAGGATYVRYSADSLQTGLLKVLPIATPATAITGTNAPGDYFPVVKKVVGQSKGFYCTAYGAPGTLVSEGNL